MKPKLHIAAEDYLYGALIGLLGGVFVFCVVSALEPVFRSLLWGALIG